MHSLPLALSLSVQWLLLGVQPTVARAVVNGTPVEIDRVALSANTTDSLSLCRDFTIPISVNKTVEAELSLDDYDIESLYAWAGREVLVHGDYEMSARICDPPPGVERKDTLQLLMHGATFNKHMWDFPYKPETHSWVRFMANAGYTTLAIDYIGCGNSSHPDGLFDVQTELFVQTAHQIVQSIRTENLLGRSFSKISFVGFSIGAIVANAVADKFPEDADSLVLLGITWDREWLYPAFLAGLQTTASVVDPTRWGDRDPFYQTQPTLQARQVACFFGDFEEEAALADFETRDLDTLGMAITFSFHLVEAPKYEGPVFLGIGDHDSTFCPRKCGSQPYGVYDQFPLASEHVVKVYKDTGHALLYHRTAPLVMQDTLSFLASI
ncbi:hypothetical protein HYQ45_013183 [Verticillium longisporum]|uniref:AB hydrolase-1 domain-containing protein n=3 Tax=Verticillium longisporum TaxID=100787 RepID=A0A0G4NEX5_VERLO|nr:hypothetical protein HYQ44_005625 [Verticillium longisporum]KAG7125502.1 hypothetical protein HYQ45_013183 [Verticillium longisporum]CRK45151.1 hypothetical protein BN1723_016490 [Verticillium longisporum]